MTIHFGYVYIQLILAIIVGFLLAMATHSDTSENDRGTALLVIICIGVLGMAIGQLQ